MFFTDNASRQLYIPKHYFVIKNHNRIVDITDYKTLDVKTISDNITKTSIT